MPLVDAKCTNCGATLKVDNNMEAAICEYCGSAFIVEKAINNYSITNKFNANVVNIYNNNNTVPFFDIKEKEYSENEIIMEIEKAGFKRLLSPYFLMEAIDYSKKHQCKPVLEKVEKYCVNLQFSFNFDYINEYSNFYSVYYHGNGRYSLYELNGIWEKAGYDNDFRHDAEHFISWINFDTDSLIEKYNVLTTVQKKVTNYYIELIKYGKMEAEFDEGHNGILLWGVRANKYGVFKDVKTQLKNKFLYNAFMEGLSTAENFGPNRSEYLFALGKYDIHWDSEYSSYIASTHGYHMQIVNERNKRKQKNLCQYCGGYFKGFFTKVCSTCGKSKDY